MDKLAAGDLLIQIGLADTSGQLRIVGALLERVEQAEAALAAVHEALGGAGEFGPKTPEEHVVFATEYQRADQERFAHVKAKCDSARGWARRWKRLARKLLVEVKRLQRMADHRARQGCDANRLRWEAVERAEKAEADAQHWRQRFEKLEGSRASCCVRMEDERDEMRTQLLDVVKALRERWGGNPAPDVRPHLESAEKLLGKAEGWWEDL